MTKECSFVGAIHFLRCLERASLVLILFIVMPDNSAMLLHGVHQPQVDTLIINSTSMGKELAF